MIHTLKNVIHIPVLYNLEMGPDLEEVASYNNLTIEEVVQIHTTNEYLVYMLGFMRFPILRWFRRTYSYT